MGDRKSVIPAKAGTQARQWARGLIWIPAFAGMTFLLMHPAFAQSMTVDLGKTTTGTAAGRLIQLVILMTVITLAPSILVMTTSFMRIIIVLSFLRSALGLQQTPPNQVLISLALFLTAFIMAPAFEQAYNEGLKPLMSEQITEEQALEKIGAPFHA